MSNEILEMFVRILEMNTRMQHFAEQQKVGYTSGFEKYVGAWGRK